MNLLFDKNLSRPAVEALALLIEETREGSEIRHLNQDFDSGTPDSGWIEAYAQKDQWLLVTADRAKRCGGDRLPRLCKEAGLRHVLLSGKISQLRQFEKIRALVQLWPKLKAAQSPTVSGE